MPFETFGYDVTRKAPGAVPTLTERSRGDSVPLSPEDPPRIIGAPVHRVDAVDKVTGRARYASDVRLPGLLYAAVARSPVAHAHRSEPELENIRAMPGVVDVIGPAEAHLDGRPLLWYDEDIALFPEIVRYQGDEIAAVAAVSREAAKAAVDAIAPRFRALSHATDIDQALAPDAAVLHGRDNLAAEPKHYARGNVDEALRQAESDSGAVVESEFETQAALHQPLEAHATTAVWHGDQLVVWESTQGIHAVRDRLAEVFGLPQGRVRVICEAVGGGFGAKQVAWKQTVIAALLALRTGRPVQLVLDRRGECLAAGNRNPTRQAVRLAATTSGKLTAIRLSAYVQGGAYTVGGESSNVSGLYQFLYDCPDVRTSQQRVYTNTGPAVAFRAPGYVEGCFALESAMDELARVSGLDPFELRRLNVSQRNPVSGEPWSNPRGLQMCADRAREAFDWDQRDERRHADAPWKRGFGMAVHEWIAAGGGPPASAWIVLNRDASAQLIVGTQDIGTGSATVLVQAVCEILCLDPERVSIRLGDTAAGPYAPTSAGSTTAPTMIPTVRNAAADVRRQLLSAAAAYLDADPGQLVLAANGIADTASGELRLDLPTLMASLKARTIQGHGTRQDNPADVSIRPFGALCAEVLVNRQTGEIRVERIVCAPDCGRIVNRRLADSQVIGGVTQGIGYALTERRIVDPALGVVLNADLEEYLVPTLADVPPIDHAAVDHADTLANPIGVKGLGELPMIPCAPAIANAIRDAVGVRFTRLPITRADVLDALAEREEDV